MASSKARGCLASTIPGTALPWLLAVRSDISAALDTSPQPLCDAQVTRIDLQGSSSGLVDFPKGLDRWVTAIDRRQRSNDATRETHSLPEPF